MIKKTLPVLLPDDVDLNVIWKSFRKTPFVEAFTKLCIWRLEVVSEKLILWILLLILLGILLRFCSPKNEKYGYDINDVKYWMPVDQYIGGVEHAILHLLIFKIFHESSSI